MLFHRLARIQPAKIVFCQNRQWSRKNVRSYCSTNIDRGFTEADCKAFKSLFAEVKRTFISHIKQYDNTIMPNRIGKCMDYMLAHGPYCRGHMVVLAYKLLADSPQLTSENIKLAQLVGWCIEMQETYLLIADDFIDRTDVRRGKDAWHKVENTNEQAFNDAVIMEYGSYICLEKFIGHKDYYGNIAQRFQSAIFSSHLGHSLDVLTSNIPVENFTMEKYLNLVKHKFGEFGYYIPVALALEMCRYRDPKVYEEAFKILTEISMHSQIRDDCYDCFGRPEDRGNDIQLNKLSWLAVNAVERASKEQLNTLKSCYGQNDTEKVEKVRTVYKDLGLYKLHKQYESDYFNRMKRLIENSSVDALKPVYQSIFLQIYERDRLDL